MTTPLIPCRPRHYDVQVAKQIAILTRLNLEIHIPKKGEIWFRPVAPWFLRKEFRK